MSERLPGSVLGAEEPRAPRFVPEVLERQLWELERLWWQRGWTLRDPRLTLRDFCSIERRIEAHREGLRGAGTAAVPLLESRLGAEDGFAVAAAAGALLDLGLSSAAEAVLAAFSSAEGERLEGLRLALCHAPLGPLAPRLLDLFRSAPLPVALAAGDALAFHAALEATRPEIERFVAAEAPVVRLNGWRLVGYLGSPVSAEHLGAAMRDEPGVRRAALEAGAWCREAGVLRAARKLAEAPAAENLDALELLAILGEERDLPVMEGVAAARELGAVRYRVLGAFGHPALVEAILEGLEDPDPVVAGAAAAAFTKLTGQDIGSERYVSAEPRPGAASEEAGGAEPVWQAPVRLPDPARARAHWREAGGRFAGSARICRGFDLARGLGVEEFAALDMESRWEVCLRARFAGVWSGTALSLEVFPQYGGR